MRIAAWSAFGLLLEHVVGCYCGTDEIGSGCVETAGVYCDDAALSAQCAAAFPSNPYPVLCPADAVPDGNCKALDVVASCGTASGGVYCCGPN